MSKQSAGQASSKIKDVEHSFPVAEIPPGETYVISYSPTMPFRPSKLSFNEGAGRLRVERFRIGKWDQFLTSDGGGYEPVEASKLHEESIRFDTCQVNVSMTIEVTNPTAETIRCEITMKGTSIEDEMARRTR
jgi:hypothetical protein